jgi:hypothetical protein
MYVELTTGNDSFRAQGGSAKRNCSVKSWVRVADGGQGKTVVPLFEAYAKKLRGFKAQNLVQQIPATAAHGPDVGGSWYVNRHEVLPSTELLLEYQHRDPNSSFGTDTEYLLLVADETAPLVQVRLALPVHHLSAVPYVFFQGRFDVVTNDKVLAKPAVWLDYLHLDAEEFDVSDLLDPNVEEPFFDVTVLEKGSSNRTKAKTVISADGKERVKIRRGRRIKVK